MRWPRSQPLTLFVRSQQRLGQNVFTQVGSIHMRWAWTRAFHNWNFQKGKITPLVGPRFTHNDLGTVLRDGYLRWQEIGRGYSVLRPLDCTPHEIENMQVRAVLISSLINTLLLCLHCQVMFVLEGGRRKWIKLQFSSPSFLKDPLSTIFSGHATSIDQSMALQRAFDQT